MASFRVWRRSAIFERHGVAFEQAFRSSRLARRRRWPTLTASIEDYGSLRDRGVEFGPDSGVWALRKQLLSFKVGVGCAAQFTSTSETRRPLDSPRVAFVGRLSFAVLCLKYAKTLSLMFDWVTFELCI